MLDTLRRIIQEVNAAPDLDRALDIIVQRVRESVVVDVASVYLVNAEEQQYVLSATEGLRKDAIGNVRFNLDEGLVGVVGRREEPVNLEDAPLHPRYRFTSGTGEEPYHGFLGVPVPLPMPVPVARFLPWYHPSAWRRRSVACPVRPVLLLAG